VPVERVVLTSTTHIPSLEALGLQDRLVGFPGLEYVSSPLTRQRITGGQVEELGTNEHLNTEKVLALQPDLVMGFGVSGVPRQYQALQASGIPLVLNGDWMEEDPLGKAEWILLFGLLFGREEEASEFFQTIESGYLEARKLARGSQNMPTVLSGALYRDVWYLPGGNSWAASFIRDAHARYLWGDTGERGSLSLSVEAVLERATEADFWVAPSQFVSYREMEAANPHYRQFRAFRERKVFTYARSTGPGKGMLYFELGPNRPDLVLKDLIHWFHPGLLPEHQPVFFKPLTE
jgi:iron complex transport system substrate-binding protein